MRALVVLPAAFAAVLAFSPLAMAATTTSTVKSVDLKAMKLTTADGHSYMIPKNFKDPGLKPGEKVRLTWTMHKKHRDLSSAAIVK
jgi:hypothetical protein